MEEKKKKSEARVKAAEARGAWEAAEAWDEAAEAWETMEAVAEEAAAACRTECALQDTQRNLNSAHLAVMAAVTRLADSRNTQQEAK